LPWKRSSTRYTPEILVHSSRNAKPLHRTITARRKLSNNWKTDYTTRKNACRS
jgi:hypothetical protein